MRSSIVAAFALLAALAACGGPRTAPGSNGQCRSDDECIEAMGAECPGGSSTFAVCNSGACQFEGCSSPIGTPCDDDPSTRFEGDDSCPADDNVEPRADAGTDTVDPGREPAEGDTEPAEGDTEPTGE